MEQSRLLQLLTKYEELFDGTLGDFNTDPVKFNLRLAAKPYHGKSYPVPQSLREEVEQLCQIGVLKRQPEPEWCVLTVLDIFWPLYHQFPNIDYCLRSIFHHCSK